MTSTAIASSTEPVPTDWTTRKREAVHHLDQLRRERGIARLDGASFDDRTIVQAEAELDAINAAEVESQRRIRTYRDQAAARHRATLRAELVETLDLRSNALRDAEHGAYKLASALETLVSTSRDVRRLMQSLGFNAPLSLSESDVKDRASMRIAAALWPVCGNRFGRLTIPAIRGPHFPDGTSAKDSWHDSDALKIGPEITPALIQEQSHD